MMTLHNIITFSRVLLSGALLFFPAFSVPFCGIYVAAGVTDVIDGAVARRTGAVSAFGSRLDTFADFVFVVVCLFKLLPALDVPVWIVLWTAAIAAIKVFNLVSGWVLRREFVSLHTAMNKVVGLMLFILPLTVQIVDLRYSAVIVCAAATFAAIQEGHYIRMGRV